MNTDKTKNSGLQKGKRLMESIASDAITKKLRSYYSNVQDEGIPERFLDLLEQLDAAEKANKEKPSS